MRRHGARRTPATIKRYSESRESEGPREHLEATIGWLCRAQDASGDGGVALAYAPGRGWLPPFPETTGYIIPTFFDCASCLGDAGYRQRAVRMADWLGSTQMPSGAFPSGPIGPDPTESVFNSGQILFGLMRAHTETQDPRHLERADVAGEWLLRVQDADGAWRRFAYNGIPHAYYTRVAWALIELSRIAERNEYREAGARQIQWALAQRRPSGWLANNSFDGRSDPFTHNIVYAAEGLVGAGLLLEDAAALVAAKQIGSSLRDAFESDGYLAGTFDGEWRATAKYSCLTGSAQLAGMLLRQPFRDACPENLSAALDLNAQIRATQELYSPHPGLRGGIKGSDPIWGGYVPYMYPNWSAKFFADAMLLEDAIARNEGTGPFSSGSTPK